MTNLVPRAFPFKLGGVGKDPGVSWLRAQQIPENRRCNKLVMNDIDWRFALC